ncbi:MFS transporter [Fodinicola feengrottensis]|uniref:MFS transporter n=1 Tax=Fodinicola feengrottensis TaxID=435914 RepID=UPI0036F3364A
MRGACWAAAWRSVRWRRLSALVRSPGPLLFSWLGPWLPRWQTFALCFLLAGAPRLVVGLLRPSLVIMVIATFVLSVGFGTLNPIIDTVLYVRVLPELRARVFAVVNACVLACVPVGALAMGVLVDGVGWFGAILAWAALYLAATLCPLVFRGWRELNAEQVRPPSLVNS